jgi:hypothetical protein
MRPLVLFEFYVHGLSFWHADGVIGGRDAEGGLVDIYDTDSKNSSHILQPIEAGNVPYSALSCCARGQTEPIIKGK